MAMNTSMRTLVLFAVTALVGSSAPARLSAQVDPASQEEPAEQEPDRFLEECGGNEREQADEESRFSDECIPLADIPNRPRPIIELGAPFLGTGVLSDGINMPGGAVWQPALMAFATWRNAVQGVSTGTGTDDLRLVEAVSRLDLFGNLYLTQTERLLVGIRPLDQNGTFTSATLYQNPDGMFPEDTTVLNAEISTLFFEGDIGEIFPNLDNDDSSALDYYFSVGRQPVAFEGGALVAEDRVDMLGLTRANMKIGGLINTRLTGVWAWDEVTRHSAAGNVTDPDASMFGLFSEIDLRATTLELDAAYVQGSDASGDGLHVGLGDTRRIGGANNTFRAMASFPVGDETEFNTRGFLVQDQIGWTPHHSHNWWYIGAFVGIDRFRSAARGESAGGPAGSTGLLFAAPGIGRAPAPMGNQVDNAAGGALGYQMFFGDARQQLIFELGGRVRIRKDEAQGSDLAGFLTSFQAAMGRRFVLVLQGFGTYDFEAVESNVNLAGRFELQLRM
jgi:hypothetical protein